MSIIAKSLKTAAVVISLGVAGLAAADPIQAAFNIVPTGPITCNNADVTFATSCSPGAPDIVTVILANNIGLLSGQTISLSTIPLTLGASFTKTFTTPLGIFTELLTVNLVTPGPSSIAITGAGTISCTGLCTNLTSAPVFFSASYTQNGGPGNQINASFNNSTIAQRVPEPATLALLGLGFGMLGFALRRKT